MSTMVRAIAHGPVIEDFFDKKLVRKKHIAVSTPRLITDDPEFMRPQVAYGAARGASEESATNSLGSANSPSDANSPIR